MWFEKPATHSKAACNIDGRKITTWWNSWLHDSSLRTRVTFPKKLRTVNGEFQQNAHCNQKTCTILYLRIACRLRQKKWYYSTEKAIFTTRWKQITYTTSTTCYAISWNYWNIPKLWVATCVPPKIINTKACKETEHLSCLIDTIIINMSKTVLMNVSVAALLNKQLSAIKSSCQNP